MKEKDFEIKVGPEWVTFKYEGLFIRGHVILKNGKAISISGIIWEGKKAIGVFRSVRELYKFAENFDTTYLSTFVEGLRQQASELDDKTDTWPSSLIEALSYPIGVGVE